MDLFRQRQRNEREREREREREGERRGEEEEEGVQIKVWNLNVVKKESNIINCSAHKSNSKVEVTFGFYTFSGLFEYIKGE